MSPFVGRRVAAMLSVIVFSVAITGFFIGLQSPGHVASRHEDEKPAPEKPSTHDQVSPATEYRDLPSLRAKRHIRSEAVASLLVESRPNPAVPIIISEQDKTESLSQRQHNRAFNGAPPTVPHKTEGMSIESCAICHTAGTRSTSLRIPAMSHPSMPNCLQCLVESQSEALAPMNPVDNLFAGLPAPRQGVRAFTGAPPQIPHSTWMRDNCLACHGPSGLKGIQTTHPWRANCRQCHPPAWHLDQVPISPFPTFLSAPKTTTVREPKDNQ